LSFAAAGTGYGQRRGYLIRGAARSEDSAIT
jgi:hypothetical protein